MTARTRAGPRAQRASRRNRRLVARGLRAGIARCTLRLGDVRGGAALAAASGDADLARECAAILEAARHPAEAAALYAQCGMHEKAVALLLGRSTKPE